MGHGYECESSDTVSMLRSGLSGENDANDALPGLLLVETRASRSLCLLGSDATKSVNMEDECKRLVAHYLQTNGT